MAKLTWFKFSPADWLMGRIQRQPDNVQVAFLRLCCKYWNDQCDMTHEAAIAEAGEDELQSLIKAKVIKIEDEHIKIGFLDEQLGGIEETAKDKRKAAKERWKNKKANAEPMHVHTSAMQNDADGMHVHQSAGKTMHVHDCALQNDADKIRREEIRKEESESNTHAQKVFQFPGKPIAANIPEPPQHVLQAIAEDQARRFMVYLNKDDVLGAWSSWLAINVTGTKFYPDVGDVYRHFANRCQQQKIIAVPKQDPKHVQTGQPQTADKAAIARKYG